jgi:hypothetical protein
MSEIEIFRVTPTQGKHYYAILATRTYWDKDIPAPWGGKGNHRYFAKETDKRYMGVFESSWRAGSGDGMTYTEIYIKDGKRIQLDYDYYGNTCLIETDSAPENSIEDKVVPIDKQISASVY